ncbi:MAG: HesA/MoeB/ThiF family protein [Gemmataceae bacterium]|nr:HesA/MoeB/ThiF family protein [Gemmataceae bacterium]
MLPLDDFDRSRYDWQLAVTGFSEEGQRRLKNASVLVSRIGGVGGMVALQLAAAGVGRLVLAHGGNLRTDDLNRQILMSDAGIGCSRVEQAAARLRAINPNVVVETAAENMSAANAPRLVATVDAVASCAPRFEERLAMNAAAVVQGKPMVDAAMYDMDLQLLIVRPGRTACLACLFPEPPGAWKRKFPVFGAVAATVGCMAAMELIKILAGFGEPLENQMLVGDMTNLGFRKVRIRRRPHCSVCQSSPPSLRQDEVR